MRNLKVIAGLSLSALLTMSCSGGGSEPAANANKAASAPATEPAAANANNNTAPAQPAAASSSNANSGAKESAKAADEKKADDKKKDESKTQPAAKIDAAGLFVENKCVGCHGPDGKGNPKIKGVPDFTDAGWQKKTSDGDMTEAIKSGKKPIMPAFAAKLSDDQVKALVSYVRGFGKK